MTRYEYYDIQRLLCECKALIYPGLKDFYSNAAEGFRRKQESLTLEEAAE